MVAAVSTSSLLQVNFIMSFGNNILLQLSHSSLSNKRTLSEIKYSYSSLLRKLLFLNEALTFLQCSYFGSNNVNLITCEPEVLFVDGVGVPSDTLQKFGRLVTELTVVMSSLLFVMFIGVLSSSSRSFLRFVLPSLLKCRNFLV